jgi:peptide/nickel transport system substrate-binding protein
MRIGIGTPAVATQASGVRFVISSLSGEPWLTGGLEGRQSARLVSDWSWNPEHTTLRLNLRQDVYFHDGTRLNAELGAQILRQTIADKTGQLSFASIRSVAVSGEYALDLILSEPNSFLLPDLAISSVRLPDKPTVGTGPFQVTQSDDQHTILKAFPKYYRGTPSITEVTVNSYPTLRSAWAALLRGEIDMLHEVSRDALEWVKAEKTVKTYSFRRPYYISLVFNQRHPVLGQPAVRRAISEAFDKPLLVRDALNGRGRPADGPIWPEHWAYSTRTAPFDFNPTAARTTLEAAKFKIHPGKNGGMPGRFSFTCLVFADDTRFDRLAVLVQRELADVGVDMKLLPLKTDALEARLKSGDFDAFLFEMAGRSLSWVYDFWHSHEGIRVNSGYRSADAVLDRIRGARSDDEVRSGMAELARVLHDDPPAAFLAWQETTRAVSATFDVAAEKDRDVLANLWQWRPVPPTKQASR